MSRVDFHGTPAVRIEAPGGASAVVALHGAQLLSWIPARGREWIYLSPRAEFAHGKAIRGGVPICFPQFAALGPLPKHGLVRTRTWRMAGKVTEGDAARVTFAIEPDAELRALWPHRWRLEHSVRIAGARLQLELGVENLGSAPFPFTAALHGYFAVGDVERAAIAGLRGVEYRDAAAGDALRVEPADEVLVRGEVDRVYHSLAGELALREPDRALSVRAEGFPDVVVWNPGAAKCAALTDMEPDGWRRMLCLEAGAIRTPVVVPPGGRWRGRQLLEELTPG